jgi:hypothetical protein
MGRIATGWNLSKKSFALVEHDRRLLFSIIATILAAMLIFGPVIAWHESDHGNVPWIVGVVVAALALNIISTFFGVAFISVARRSLDGESWTAADGWRCARARLVPIVLWAIVATFVGLLLHALERVRGGVVVNVVVRWLVGAAWSLATFFVVPVLALEGGNPFQAAKRSIQVIRKRWGEGVVGSTAIGGIFVIVFFAAAIPLFIGFATLSSTPWLGIPLILIGVAIVAVGIVVNSAVSQLFRFVLYEYAERDRALGPFTPSDLDSAFRPKRRLFGSA